MHPQNVTDVLGPIKATGSPTEAITLVGDASLGTSNPNGSQMTVFPCFRTDAAGPWQAFPNAVADLVGVQNNIPVAQARTGFLTPTTVPPLLGGTSYYVALCGETQITASPTNAWVDNAKVIVTHLP
jgi:hypothetical protein